MNDDEIIEKTRAFVEEKFGGDSSGHDYWHMYRVWQLSRQIARTEAGADRLTLELAALLHDVADWKFTGGDEDAAVRGVRDWLEGLGVGEVVIREIEDILRNVSFSSSLKGGSKLDNIEGKIVHDADKLDGIGAIGIARTFAYGGTKGRLIHDPNRPPKQFDSIEAYKNNDGPTLNHFYEKLLLMKDRMLTKTGRDLAAHRHEVMVQFLDEFAREWDGKR